MVRFLFTVPTPSCLGEGGVGKVGGVVGEAADVTAKGQPDETILSPVGSPTVADLPCCCR